MNGSAGSAIASSAADHDVCAIQSGSGAVVCWGNSTVGQLDVPTALDGIHGQAGAISAGGAFTLAIRSVPACSDGLDDDGDGKIDYPSDPGCRGATNTTENPQCQDGIDNDGDGKIDFDGGASTNLGVALAPADPQCGAAYHDRESQSTSCGLGAELALVMPSLLWLRRRRVAATRAVPTAR